VATTDCTRPCWQPLTLVVLPNQPNRHRLRLKWVRKRSTPSIRRIGKRIHTALALGCLTLVVVGGCGGPAGRMEHSRVEKSLFGTFHIVTGGVAYVDVGGSGRVALFQGRRRVAQQIVESGGSFRVRLAPGTYGIASTCVPSPSDETQLSEPTTVRVRSGAVSRVDVTCLLDPTTG
jgi:hypothetical protein